MTTQALSSRAIVGNFYKQLEQGTHPWAARLSHYNPNADQASEEYHWLGQSPAPREWVGGRHAKQLRDNPYTITNKKWESTIEIPADHVRRDKTGQIDVRVAEMATRYNAHRARLLSELIVNGPATVCYDGQYFFDTDHSEGDSGTQSNDLSVDISAIPCTSHGTITAPSACEFAHATMQAVAAMLGFLDDQGEPMNEEAREFHVIVPPSLWLPAIAGIGARVIDSGDDNPVAIANADGYSFNVHANARLTGWTDEFAVFRGDGNVKPFIFQEDAPLEVTMLGEGSDFYFTNDAYQFGTKAVNNAGYGYWQHGCLVTMV